MEHIGSAKTVTFYSNENEEFHISKKKTFKENYSPFSMIGPLRRKNTRKVYMDIFDLLTTISKSELLLFNQIKLQTDPEVGIAVMEEFATYDLSTVKNNNKRLANLIKIDLIRKVIPFELSNEDLSMLKANPAIPEKYSYMINPQLIKPWKYELAKQIWGQLKNNKED